MNIKLNYLRTMSLILLILMLVTMLPVNTFAEVKRSDWTGDETTLSEDSNYWPLANKNKLIRVGLIAEPIHVPNVNFIGMYYTKDSQGNDRQVLRFTFNKYQTSQTAVWKRLVIKFDKKLYDAVDWDNAKTGIYKEQQFNKWDDHPNYKDMEHFYSINNDPKESMRAVGDKYVKWVDLQDYRLNTGLRGRYKIPFELMLKEGQDIKKFDDDILIQLRLYNFDWTMVYTKSNVADENGKSGIPYNNYTFTTFVPVKTDIKWTLQNEVACPSEAPFKACDVYLNYNEEEGYIDVVHKQGKDGSGNDYFGDSIGFFESFSTKFKDILKEDSRGVVGKVFVTNHHDNPVNNTSIDIYKNMINDDSSRGISFIQLASANGWWGNRLQYKDPDINGRPCDLNDSSRYPIKTIFNDQDESDKIAWPNSKRGKNRQFIHSVLNAGSSGASSGTGTVVRYYVDKDKVNKSFDKGGLNAFAFFGTFLRRPFAHNAVTKAEFTMSGDQYLTKGTQITFSVDQPLDPYCKVNLCVGKDQFKLYFRDSINYTGSNGINKTKQFTWTVPYDILIKDGTPITVSTKVGQVKRGATIRRLINSLPTTMTVNGLQVSESSTPCNEDYTAKIIPYSESISGGAIAKTYYTPKVDEIFTDSQNIHGHSFYGGAEVSISTPVENANGVENKVQQIASKEIDDPIYTKGLENNTSHYKRLRAHKFDTQNPNPNGGTTYGFQMPNLVKDAPLIFTNKNLDSQALDSNYVVEQVQTKVNFNLNGKTSLIDGRDVIEKVVPLNRNYFYTYDEKAKTFTKNTNYVPNGFSIENSKVAGTTEVEVQQKLNDGKTIKRKAINYLNHYDETYDIDLPTDEEEIKKEIEAQKTAYKKEIESLKRQKQEAEQRLPELKKQIDAISRWDRKRKKKQLYESLQADYDSTSSSIESIKEEIYKMEIKQNELEQLPAYIADKNKKIKQKAIEDLIKRQMPISDEVKSDKVENIIGWTTKPLKDTPQKSQADQFYELESKENSKIRTLDDWKKVDNAKEDEIYIFDKNSPVDKERTVYAVYGGASIILHSGIKDRDGKEIVKRLPLASNKDFTYTNDQMKKWKGNSYIESTTEIMKKIPLVPYLGDQKRISEADELLKAFNKKEYSFIGWKAIDPDDLKEDNKLLEGKEKEKKIQEILNKFDAGQNNDRINTIYENSESLPEKTESLSHIRTSKNAYLPNGFNLLFKTTDLGLDGKAKREDILTNAKEIHLYAIYRPYFKVKVNPRYMDIDRTKTENNHQYGSYVDLKENNKDKPQDLQIALLTRTAVTDYEHPTVASNANYNPITSIIEDGSKAIQEWKKENTQGLTWKVPGYDELGRRKSYVAIVINDNNKELYNTIGSHFNENTWKEFGITTYFKWAGAQQGNAPKNIHDTIENADPYGIAMAKTQNFTTKNGQNETKLDVFTSATQRQAVKAKDGKEELKGYNIIMTNSPENIPKPMFKIIKSRDEDIVLEWPSMGYKLTDYSDISKIKLEIVSFDSNSSCKPGEDCKLNEIKHGSWNLDKGVNGGILYQFSKDGKNINVQYGHYQDSPDTIHIKADKDIYELSKYSGKYVAVTYYKDVMVGGKKVTLESYNIEPIIPIKTSKPVKEMSQVPKNTPDDPTVKINFTVPTGVLDQVTKGTKYIAEKWNGTTWQKVGEKVLDDNDLIDNQFQGNKYDMDLTGVNHGDKIRIVSYDNNPLTKVQKCTAWGCNQVSIYTNEDKANGCQDGYSMPNYSTRKVEDGVNVGAKDEALVDENSRVNREYVIIDLKGPEIKPTAKDEAFRRYIDIRGKLDEVPEGKLLLEIGTTSDENYQKYEFDSKEQAIEFINTIPRLDNMPTMKITAVDEMGNKSQTDVEYTHEKNIRLEVLDCRKRRKDFNIKCDVAGATVTATVYKAEGDQTVVASGTVTIENADTFTKLTIYKQGEPTKTYRLKSGNLVRFTAEKKDAKGNIEYRANPMDVLIK